MIIVICGHMEREYYSLRYLSIISFLPGLARLHRNPMDTVTSTSASLTLTLPTLPVRTVTASISVSSSRSHRSTRQRLYSLKRSFSNSSSSSTVPKFTVRCGITEINESQFNETVLKSDRPVLVEFVATWCGPCRLITPAMESIAQVPLSLFLSLGLN